jgi:hypothetical protein
MPELQPGDWFMFGMFAGCALSFAASWFVNWAEDREHRKYDA